MTSSPFAAYANAVIRFQVASGNLEPDSNGNLRPGRAVVEATAMLSQKRDPNREPRPGVDITAIWLEGYLVEPRPLPSIITPDSPAEITWQGRAGQFHLEFTARNPYLQALDIDLVERIRGYFQPGSFVVQGEPWEPTPPQPPDPSGDGNQYSAPVPAAANLSALRIVTIQSGQLVYADSSNPAHAFRVLGILPTAVNAGAAVQALTDGSISDNSWNWQPDRPVWLGANGLLTQTAPGAGFLLQVATAVTPITLDFEIQEAILL